MAQSSRNRVRHRNKGGDGDENGGRRAWRGRNFRGSPDIAEAPLKLMILVNYLTEDSLADDCVTTFEVLDAAQCLKRTRHEEAISLLLGIGCDDLASRVNLDVAEPSRSWINDFCQRNGLKPSSVSDVQELLLSH